MIKGQVISVEKVTFNNGTTFYKSKLLIKIDESDILIEKFCKNELRQGQQVQVILGEDSDSGFKKIAVKSVK